MPCTLPGTTDRGTREHDSIYERQGAQLWRSRHYYESVAETNTIPSYADTQGHNLLHSKNRMQKGDTTATHGPTVPARIGSRQRIVRSLLSATGRKDTMPNRQHHVSWKRLCQGEVAHRSTLYQQAIRPADKADSGKS